MNLWDPKNTLDSIGIGRRENKRSVRVADVIRNEISILLVQKVRDPNIAHVSVSRVEVTDDLKYARVFYYVHGDDKVVRRAEKGLERARGFMRSHLAKTLNLRYTPALQFHFDVTVEKVEKMEKLFREIAEERNEDDDS